MGSKGGGLQVGGGGKIRMLPTDNYSRSQAESDWRQGKGFMSDRNVEYAMVYDPNNPNQQPVLYMGNRHSVNVRPEELDKEGYELTHYHPDRNEGGTLSPQDIKVFSRSKLSGIRAVTSQGVTYGVRAGANADREGLSRWIRRSDNILQKNFEKSWDSAYRRALEGKTERHVSPSGRVTWRVARDANGNPQKMTQAQARAYARRYSVAMFDRTYEKNLARYGFEYYREK